MPLYEKSSRKPFQIALVEPEIPPNTGNIGRLCVATGSVLHLVGKLGFQIDDKQVKRAGLDYWQHLKLQQHADFHSLKKANPDARTLFFSKRGKIPYTEAKYQQGDFLVFGSETTGLPQELMDENPEATYYIPTTKLVRSLNIANACSVVLYEAIRQVGTWE